MFFCPFCSKSYTCIKSLNAHCKLKHYTKLYSSFQCRQKSCPRIFGDIYTFYKRLFRNHSKKQYKEKQYRKNNIIIDTSHSNRNIEMNENIEETIYNSSLESIEMPSTSCAINRYDNILSITTEEFAEKIAKTSALFVAGLYSKQSLSRVFCQEMINSIKIFLDCVKMIENRYKSIELNSHSDLNSMFDILYNAFADYTSEYKTMLYFKTLNCLIEPEEISIGAFIDSKLMKTDRQVVVKNKKICTILLEKILKKFLELPGVYDKIISNIKKIKQNKIITSILQSKMWRSIEQQYRNDVLPLILYSDDFEINNPLGSQRGLHKLGVVYCTVGGIDEEYASILENIFLVQLHNVIDYKQFENKCIFFNSNQSD